MLTLTKAIDDIISGDSFLQYGLQYRLFNLTQLAQHIQKHVEARSKKSVSISAVLMALSRYQRRLKTFAPHPEQFAVQDLTVRLHIATVSITKTAMSVERVHAFHTQIQEKKGYMTITESTGEVTMLFDAEHLPAAKKLFGDDVKSSHAHLAALALRFPSQYAVAPGFLCTVLQQLMLQGINVVEVASTFTEFVLYVDEGSAKLAFETLYGLFRVGRSAGLRPAVQSEEVRKYSR